MKKIVSLWLTLVMALGLASCGGGDTWKFSSKAITAFSLAGVTGTINETGKSIAVTMPFGTDVTALVATFTTTGIRVSVETTVQYSGTTANDYTNPLTYTVTAADGTMASYTVTVAVAKSSAKAISAFSLAGVTGTINETGKSIAVTMPFGTDITALVATFTTTGAGVSVGTAVQHSGTTANDYTNPLTYTVTAADGTMASYTVTVAVAMIPAKAITAFSLAGVTGTIDETGKSIAVTMPFGTDITALVATFTTTGAGVSVGTTVQHSGTTANDYTNPLTYTVTAADGTMASYTVTVAVAKSSAKAITAFSLAGVTGTINETDKSIAVTMPFGTDVAALVATFTTTGAGVSVGTAVQYSGTTANDYTNPLTYTVTAADGTMASYTVMVAVAKSSAKAITAYSLAGVTGTINEMGRSIAVTMPFGTDVTALVATFTTTGAGVSVGTTVQYSGTTANDYTNPLTYTVTAADGTMASYTVTVNVTATGTRTYQVGTLLYLETHTSSDTFRIGLDTKWGGTIVEASLNGNNYINAHDTGREVQTAQYDGAAEYDNCAGCTGVWGWDPVQGGDIHNHGSPVISQNLTDNSIYVKTQELQWYPDDKGGGANKPILDPTYAELTVSAIAGYPSAFKVHWQVSYQGTARHFNARQEFPAAYVNLAYSRMVTYSGTAPWTYGQVASGTLPSSPLPAAIMYTPEQWVALVDNNNMGLTLFYPGVIPYTFGIAFSGTGGTTGYGTNYVSPFVSFTFLPNTILSGDTFIMVGDYTQAIPIVYALHSSFPSSDGYAPFGYLDEPAANSQVTGLTVVAGWAMDNVAVAGVQVYVDGSIDGTATYGLYRPDIASVFSNAPSNLGFQYTLNTSRYPNGQHTLEVRVTDSGGNVAIYPDVEVAINN